MLSIANCVQDLALAKPTTNNRHDYLPKNRQPQYRSQIVASFLTGRKGIPQLALNPSCKTPMKGSRFNLTATVRDQAALPFSASSRYEAAIMRFRYICSTRLRNMGALIRLAPEADDTRRFTIIRTGSWWTL